MLQEQKTKRVCWTRWLCGVLVMLAVCAGLRQNASAQNILLKQGTILVTAGEEVDLSGYLQEEYQNGATFQLADPTLTTENVTLSEEGKLQMKEEGVAVICVKDKASERREYLTVYAIVPEQLTLEYGLTYALSTADLLEGESCNFQSDSDSVVISENGMIEVQGLRHAQITVEQADGSRVIAAEVTVASPAFEKDAIIRAVGTSGYQTTISHWNTSDMTSLRFVAENNRIATWDEKNGFTALKQGKTTVSVILTAKNGETATLTVPFIVTNPKLSVSRIILASGTTSKLSVSGTETASEVNWDTGDGCAYFIKSGVVYGEYAGTRNVKVIVDGKELTCKIRVTDPYYSGFSFVIYKGMSKNISIKGKVALSKVKFSSGNKKIATVTAKGKVKGKKVGHTTITATVDGRKIKIWVEVSSKRGYQASKKAITISKRKTKYSQARRMSKNLYDCSSLVSRVYRQYGVYFGSKRGWSPVAANIAKWCQANHKVVSNKGVSYKKLLPGDLVFFSYKKNGRYRNITHVEMYTGEACDVSASSNYNKVVHYGYSQSDSIVMIARPTK